MTTSMKVYETHNCFMLAYGNRTACLGDGVDQTFLFRGKEVNVGDPNFCKAWQIDANKNKSEYKEAYFGIA